MPAPSPATDPPLTDRLRRWTCGIGGGLIALAAAVMAGWLTGNQSLVQVLPQATPMRFNTALLHLLLGVALIAIARRRCGVARWLGAGCAAWATVTLSQDLFGIELGIDNLLFRDGSNSGTTPPGRMAVNTAICFILTGLALASLASPGRYRWQPLYECLLGSLALAIAFVSSAGYASGLAAAYGWGGQAGMAIHAALAFTLLGAVIFATSLAHARLWSPHSPRWLPLPIGLAAFTINLIVWQALSLDQLVQLDRSTALRARDVAEHIERRLVERAQGLERMAHRWSTAGQPSRRHWQADAQQYLAHFSDLQFLGWVDPTETIRWMEPLAGNESAVHWDYSREPICHHAFSTARASRRSAITPVVDLVPGGRGVLVAAPIFCGERCEGFFCAALRVDALVNQVAQEDLAAGYCVALFDGRRQVLGPDVSADVAARRAQSAVVSLSDLSGVVHVWPSVAVQRAQHRVLPAAVFAAGSVAATLLSLLVYFAQRARAEKRAAESAVEELRSNQSRFRAIFDQTFQFIGLLTTDGTVVEANRTALAFAGISLADVIGKPFWLTPWWRHSIDLQHQLRDAIHRAAQGECIRFEATHQDDNHETHFIDFSLKPVYDNQGRVQMLVPEGRDVTDRKRAEDELTRAARLDKLTGLPNRGLLLERLKHTMRRARAAQNYAYALLFLDFDRFKIVNDSLGHEAGDDLLRQIAARLRGNVPVLDSVSAADLGNTTARLGGDEFVVLLDQLDQPLEVLHVAKRLLNAFSQPYRLGNQQVYSTASIGIVIGGSDYDRAEDVLRDADTAMYEAKRAGKARYVVFDASMRDRLQRRLRLEGDLRKAITAGELSLACQPILSLSTGEVRSVELLLRWSHFAEGPIGPAEFIPIAEESDLIHQLGDWALRHGCRQMVEWIDELGPSAPATVSINLSRKQFARPDLLARIQHALQESGLPPERLQLEITEDAFVMDERTAIATMRAIRALGVHLAIDDFGSGSSSFASVHRFPVDMIKVDRSLLEGVESSADAAALIHALAILVKNLGICMVAEGIENVEQALTLQELGCNHAQGYYFAAPMSVPEFTQFLSRSVSIDRAESGAMAFAARWADRLTL